jgi:7,8-dihydropterin-6-yl-methyl-4-(beta-D-ribofuranosyl)aminobenzene 5'-phosphate synthase
MKPIYLSLGFVILLFFAACSTTNITPVQITTPVNTFLAPTNTQAVKLIPSITATKIIISPTPAEEVKVATQTTQIKNEIAITGTQIVTITVVYDNNPYDPRLTSAWGFSALVEYHGYTLLFDTGGDGQILQENMRLLDIDPTHLDAVVLSHAHDDHTGGLLALLDAGAKPAVYLPASFPSSFKRQVEQYTRVSLVSDGQSIAEGIWTTGEIGGAIPEQALIIQTKRGLVVITGCAHPGIVAMVKQAQDTVNAPILLVLGGFHLGDKSAAAIETIVSDFEHMGVEQVAPCHCTGETAIAQFSAAYGDNFIRIGVGSTIRLEGNLIK